jgi:hypothetical protein
MYNNTVAYPWETTVENPDMEYAGGAYYLLFSGGEYDSSGYALRGRVHSPRPVPSFPATGRSSVPVVGRCLPTHRATGGSTIRHGLRGAPTTRAAGTAASLSRRCTWAVRRRRAARLRGARRPRGRWPGSPGRTGMPPRSR